MPWLRRIVAVHVERQTAEVMVAAVGSSDRFVITDAGSRISSDRGRDQTDDSKDPGRSWSFRPVTFFEWNPSSGDDAHDEAGASRWLRPTRVAGGDQAPRGRCDCSPSA